MSTDDALSTRELGRRSARGGAVLLGAGVLQLGVVVVSTLFLARLLRPEDFGLFAMAMVAIGVVAPLRDFGLPFALVHHPALDERQLSRLFVGNLLLALALAAAMAFGAPLFAAFFEEPRLLAMTLILAVAVFARATANLQSGLLQRSMRFGTLATIEVLALLCGAVAGVALAWRGAGVQALLAQFLVQTGVETALLWWLAGWRPRRSIGGAVATTERSPLVAVLGFGRDLSGARVVAELLGQCDRIFVGRAGGTAALGFYDSALRWTTFPLTLMLRPLKTVCVASLSRLRDRETEYRRFARLAFCLGWSLALPSFAFIALEAGPIVRVLLGEQWRAAVPLLVLLALAMIPMAVDRMLVWLYLAEGRVRARLHWCLATVPVVLLALALGARAGAFGVALAVLIVRVALAIPAVEYCLRGSPLERRDFWRAAVRPALAVVAAVLVLSLVREFVPPPAAWSSVSAGAWRLLVDGALFASVFAAAWVGQPGGRALTVRLLSVLRRPGEAPVSADDAVSEPERSAPDRRG